MTAAKPIYAADHRIVVPSKKSPSARVVDSITTVVSGATRKMTRGSTRQDTGATIGRGVILCGAGRDERGDPHRRESTIWMEENRERAQDKVSLDSRHHPIREANIV
jgi:hypothetical protein